jgi:cytochrome c peroxidase
MRHARPARVAWLTAVLVILAAASVAGAAGFVLPHFLVFANSEGTDTTLVSDRATLDNPFFQRLGTNGRRCVTCHLPAAGWSITPETAQALFDATHGRDPLFRVNDGSTSPDADVSTAAARRVAYALLLGKGLIRVGRPVPPGAEFTLADADDPYGFASAAELSLFRRPLPSTNLAFLSTVMWDGRETIAGQTIHADLLDQASDATIGHAQGAPPAGAVLERIVRFEASLFTAQSRDAAAGPLDAAGAQGGPSPLSRQPFRLGINSTVDPLGGPVTTRVFTIFDAWTSAVGRAGARRQSVARGQLLFNERRFGSRGSTCSGCHNAPNAGSNSTAALFNLGLTDEAVRTPDLPLYTFLCTSGPLIGRTIRSTDPGLALTTGRCGDIGKFKVPTLRGLATRAPYFHNGFAPTIEAVVDFYDARFGIGFTDVDKDDLVAFLRSL